MDVTGRFKTASVDLDGKLTATFEILEKEQALTEFNAMAQNPEAVLDIKVKKHRKKRSLDANALLWSCINQIAGKLGTDSWDVYLMMLDRYGQYTYIKVREDAAERVKGQWRECREVGLEEYADGTRYLELLCYYGSSTYNTSEFSRLLDGVLADMRDMGLQIPATKDIERSLEAWEAQYMRRKR